MEIYQKLKKALKDKGITLEELGEKTNTSKVRIHNYLNGKTKIDIDIFLKICESLELSPSQILENNPDGTYSTSEKIKLLQDQINELEEELHHTQQMITELKSYDVSALFYSRLKRYLESHYYVKFENNSIDSIRRESRGHSEEYNIQYKAGIELYDKMKSLKIDPVVITSVVEMFQFEAEDKISDNKFMRNTLKDMLDPNIPYDSFDIVLFNDAKRTGNKFTQKMIEIHQEEIINYFKARNSNQKEN